MAFLSTFISVPSLSKTSTHADRNPKLPAFLELESNDSVIRYWAAKAVHVLNNAELSEKGRVSIIRDIQARILARLEEIRVHSAKHTQNSRSNSSKSMGLGCPKQIASLRKSFRQFEEPTPIVEKTLKTLYLAPRMPKS